MAVVVSFAGVSAYTTADVQRDVAVEVASDDAAILEFTANEGSTINNGELTFDADGEQLNENALFTYGDSSAPSSTNAFAVTNTDDVAHDITFSAAGGTSTDTSVTYTVYDSSGSSVATVTEGDSINAGNLGTGDTYYVVVDVDTGDDAGSAYDGTFTVEAN